MKKCGEARDKIRELFQSGLQLQTMQDLVRVLPVLEINLIMTAIQAAEKVTSVKSLPGRKISASQTPNNTGS